MPPQTPNESVPEITARRLAELRRLVEGDPDGGRWLVLTHDNPDPDSLASAALLARLLRQGLHQRVTVAYGGIIGRAENREMVRGLALKMSHVRHINFHHYRRVALVDTQPRTGNNQLPAQVVPAVVIDHHPPRKATQAAALVDVRPEYGASATILAEYLLAAGLKLGQRGATALVYAIRSETQDFRREGSGPDKRVYDLFLPRANKRLLSRIQYAPLPLRYFRYLHQALENLEAVDTLIVSHLGEVEEPDIVPEIADLLLRLEGKTWALASGRHGERVYLSIRTTNPRADAGRLMRRLVARRGKGGGHGTMAGGWVAIPKAHAAEPRALQRLLAERLATLLKKKPQKLAALPMRSEPHRGEGSSPK